MNGNRSKIGWKTRGSILLIVAFIVLLFLSKTVYSSRLPKVEGILPKRDHLKNTFVTTGVTQWGETQTIFAPLSGTLEKLSVHPGESLDVGDTVATVDYDKKEIHKTLSLEQKDHSSLLLDRESLLLDKDKLKREIKNAEKPSEDTPVKDYKMELLEIELREAYSNLKEIRKSHKEEESSDSQLASARYAVQRLELQKEALEKEESHKSQEKEKDFDKKSKEYKEESIVKKEQLQRLEIQLEQLNLRLEKSGLSQNTQYQELEEQDENKNITAPVSGTVLEVHAKEGKSVNKGEELLTLGESGEMLLKAKIPLDNDFTVLGDEVSVYNANLRTYGKIIHIALTETEKELTIQLEGNDIGAGETFTVEMEKQSEISFHLLPNGCIMKDKEGYFVLLLKERDGIMGKEYYLHKNPIVIGQQDSTHTAVTKGIDFYEPVLLRSNQSVEKGDVVVLENQEEFYEKER